MAMLQLARAVISTQQPQSVILILADDLGYNEMNWMNSSRGIHTPVLDSLAKSGIILKNYYVGAICSPTRSSLMTGRYTTRLGTQSNVIYWDTPWGVPINETFMGQNFQQSGYDTAMFGKWHLGMFKPEYTPRQRGFEEHVGYYQGCGSAWTHIASCCAEGSDYSDQEYVCSPTAKGGPKDYRGFDWFRSAPGHNRSMPEPGANHSKSTDLIRDATLEYIDRKTARGQTKPFFLYLPFQNIHEPYTTQKRFFDLYSDRSLFSEMEATIFGYISELDDAIGSIIEKLKSTRVYDNTLIVFSSDNGAPPAGATVDHPRPHAGGGAGYIARNHPLRGWKGHIWEGGTRVPGFVSGGSALIPESARGTVNDKLYHVTDWLPTLRGTLGLDTTGLPSDGHDIWTSLTTKAPSPRTEMLYNVSPLCEGGQAGAPKAGIRHGDYKLLAWCFDVAGIGNATRTGPVKAPKSKVKQSDPGFAENDGLVLYDLANDPGETTNIRAEPTYHATVEAMLTRLTELASEMVEPQQWDPPYQGKGYFCAHCPKHPGGTGVDMAWDSWL